MVVQFICPNPDCRRTGKAPDSYRGRFVRCTRCGHKFQIGAPTDPENPEPAPPSSAKRETLLSETGEYVPAVAESSGTEFKVPSSLPQQVARFQIRERLGVGAFGTVYRALDPELDREVALKIPHPGLLDSPRRRERFLREARLAGRLRHPHIVTVYEAGSDQDTHYMASALISGRTLAQVADEDSIDFTRAVRTVRDLARALAYAHGLGIVHRDVKPSNIMVDDQGEVYLMDFGLAYRLDAAERLTFQGAILGTPAYMAPEQADGKSGEAQPASDQFSLGAVLYKLLCGQPPFVGAPEVVLYNTVHQSPPDPHTLNPQVPPNLEGICLKALAKRPEDRYPSCQDLADDLDRWLEQLPTQAPMPSAPPQAASPPRRSRRKKVLALGLLATVLPVLALAFLLGKNPPADSPVLPAPVMHMDPAPVSLVGGETKVLEVAVERRERPGPIHLRLENLPHSVTAGPDQAGPLEDHFRIELTAHPEAGDAQTEVKVVASGTGWQVEKPFTLTVKRVPRYRLPEKLPPVTLIPGRRQVVEVSVERQGFAGVIQLQIDPDELPEQVVAQPATLAADQDRARITLVAADKAPRGVRVVHLRATAAGQSATAAFRITVRDAPFLSLTLDPKVVTIQPGKAQRVTVTIRRAGWEGPVGFQANNLPPGVTVQQPLPTLAANQEAAKLELIVAPDAAEVTQEVRILARAGDIEAANSLVVTVRKPLPVPAPSRSIRLVKSLPTDDVILALAVDAKNARALFGGGGKYVNGEIVGGRDFAVWSLDCTNDRLTSMTPLAVPRPRGGAKVNPKEGDRVHCLALSPAGDQAVTGHADGSLRWWSLKDKKEMSQGMSYHFWAEHKSPVMSVAFSPDGKSLVSGDRNGLVVWWSVKDRKAQARRSINFAPAQSFVTALAFSRDNRLCFVGDSRGKIWKCEFPKLRETRYTLKLAPVASDVEAHRDGVTCLALSPDGTKLVSGSADFTARVWDWQKGMLVNQFAGHGNQVYSVCFTPDGGWVLSGGYDNKVRLWDVMTGQEVCPAYEGYTQRIRCVAVFQTPDGLKALCAGLGNAVQILRLSR